MNPGEQGQVGATSVRRAAGPRGCSSAAGARVAGRAPPSAPPRRPRGSPAAAGPAPSLAPCKLPPPPGAREARACRAGGAGGRSFRRTRSGAASCPPRRAVSSCPCGTRLAPDPVPVPDNAPGSMQSRLLLLGTPGGHGGPAARRVRLLLRQVVRGRPGGDGRRPEVRLVHAGAGADTGNPGPALRAAAPFPPLRCTWEGSLRGRLDMQDLASTSPPNRCVTLAGICALGAPFGPLGGLD